MREAIKVRKATKARKSKMFTVRKWKTFTVMKSKMFTVRKSKTFMVKLGDKGERGDELHGEVNFVFLFVAY